MVMQQYVLAHTTKCGILQDFKTISWILFQITILNSRTRHLNMRATNFKKINNLRMHNVTMHYDCNNCFLFTPCHLRFEFPAIYHQDDHLQHSILFVLDSIIAKRLIIFYAVIT